MRRHRLVLVCVAVGLLAACAGIWLWVDDAGGLPREAWLADRLYSWWVASVPLEQLAQFMGDLGSASVAVGTVAVAAIVLWRNVGGWAAIGLGLAAAAVLASSGLKAVLEPTSAELQRMGPTALANFPSGHVVYATAVFGYLAVMGWRSGRREVTVIMVALVLMMGPAMVMRVAHVPSDVLAGYALGGAWLCLTLVAVDAVRRRLAA